MGTHLKRGRHGGPRWLIDNNFTLRYPISVLTTAIDAFGQGEYSHPTSITGDKRQVDFCSFLCREMAVVGAVLKIEQGSYKKN